MFDLDALSVASVSVADVVLDFLDLEIVKDFGVSDRVVKWVLDRLAVRRVGVVELVHE